MNKTDLLGLTELLNQWDDLPKKMTFDDVFKKVTKIKQTNIKTAIFIAEMDSKIVGYAFLTEVCFLGIDNFIELQSILVSKPHRGIGIGKLLLAHSETWTKENGYKKIMLSSRVQLENAHMFYTSQGYGISKQSYFFAKEI